MSQTQTNIQAIVIEPDPHQTLLLKSILNKIKAEMTVFAFKDVKEFFAAYKDALNFSSASAPASDHNSSLYTNSNTHSLSSAPPNANNSSTAPSITAISNATSNSTTSSAAVNSVSSNDKSGSSGVALHESALDLNFLRLLIADVDATCKIDQELWQKFLHKIRQQDSGASPSPLRFLYTSFVKNEEFNPRDYHSELVYNILIKPYDPTLVEQILLLALNPPGPLKVNELYQQKQPAVVELIKDIEIDRLTELGFRTQSRRPIDINKAARYYGKIFETGAHNSVFAYCYNNYEVTKDPPQYLSSFSFLGISKEQLSAVRRTLQGSPHKTEYPFSSSTPDSATGQPLSALLLTQDANFAAQLDSFIKEKFNNLNLHWYKSLAQTLHLIPPQQRKMFSSDYNPAVPMPVELHFKWKQNPMSLLDVYPPTSPLSTLTTFFDVDTKTLLNKSSAIKPLLAPESYLWLKQVQPTTQKEKVFIKFYHKDIAYSFEVFDWDFVQDSQHQQVLLVKSRFLSEEESYQQNLAESALPQKLDILFIDQQNFSMGHLLSLRSVCQWLNPKTSGPPKTFLFSQKAVKDYEQLETLKNIDDVFVLPLDPFFTTRKLKMHLNPLQLRDPKDNSRWGMDFKQGIKTALPLIIDSISEIHVSFKYSRHIRLGDVRRLILLIPNTQSMPEILAVCRYCEEVSPKIYQCDFLFFAVQDRQLRHLRQWIKLNYILEKNKNQ